MIDLYKYENELYSKGKEYVSAKGQATILKKMLDGNFFNEDEIDIIKRINLLKKEILLQ